MAQTPNEERTSNNRKLLVIGLILVLLSINGILFYMQRKAKDGKTAALLAYIDARDVMERLDRACGFENWQCRYNMADSGVLICEAMAQTGAVLMSKSLEVDTEGKAIFFMSADNCRFRAPVRPGDVVYMHVRVVRHRGDVFKFAGQAKVDGKVAAEAEFAAMVVET